MVRLAHRTAICVFAFLLLFVITDVTRARETDAVQFNGNLGFGEYGFDSGYIGLDDPLARMLVHAYGTLGLNLADVTMNGSAWTDSGVIGVDGTSDGGNFSFSLGLEYGAYAYYGIPVLGLDYELDLLALLGVPSVDLLLSDSQTFTPFLLDSSIQISDSLPPQNFGNFDVTNILFPGIPFVGAGVSLDADMELQETLSGERIYFSNPGSSIYSESSTLPFGSSSTVLSYYEDAYCEVIVGLWPGLYAEAFGYRFDFTPVRIPVTVYSSDLPIPFNNSAVNFSSTITSLNVSATVFPSSNVPAYSLINVYGTVTYNTGENVPTGIVVIDTGSDVYTASISNGAFDRNIYAPGSSGNISITASEGEYNLTATIYRSISIQGDQGGSGYDLRNCEVVYEYTDLGDGYVSWSSKDAFRTTDPFVRTLLYFENVYQGLEVKWEYFKPDGTAFPTAQYYSIPSPQSQGWEWWDRWWCAMGWQIDGYANWYEPGLYSVKVYIDDGSGYKLRRTKYFSVQYNFTEHKMCEGINGSSPYDPINPRNTFYQNDSMAWTWGNLDWVAQGTQAKWEWYEPSGSTHGDPSYYTLTDPAVQWDWYKIWAGVYINGYSAQNKCGDWNVKVYVQNQATSNWDYVYTDYFQILENPSVNPSVSVSANPSAPLETQSVTLSLTATDNTYLDTVELHWKVDGVEQTPEVSPPINNGQKDISRNIGSFSSGQQIEYWGVAIDTSGNRAESQHTAIAVLSEVVTVPERPSGEVYLQVGQSETYTTGGSVTSLGHSVQYEFDWDDSPLSGFGSATQDKSWSSEGYYFVKAHARCQTHTNRESGWSAPIVVTVDSTDPAVVITTNGGSDFETDEPIVVIEGTASDPGLTSGLASVSINTGAINEGTLTDWRFTVDLAEGLNPLTITAIDNAGNIGQDTIGITYSYQVPDIRVSENSHAFSSVVVGSHEDWMLTIHNDGSAGLSITAFDGIESTDFSLIDTPLLPFTIDPDQSYDLTIRFAPSWEGIKDATLFIVNDDPDENPADIGLMGTAIYPSVIYVDDDVMVKANNGLNWANAFTNFKDALSAAANSGGATKEIRVAQGTYKPDQGDGVTPGDRTTTFQLINGVAIKGGYAGFGEPDPDARNIDLYETILSGDLNGDDGPNFANNAENSYHVVTGSGTNSSAILDGFTVSSGNADAGYWPDNIGGGVVNEWGSPTLFNCTVSKNWAVMGGGMCNSMNSNSILTNCTFTENAATWGGGMRNYQSSPRLTYCIFNRNFAEKDCGGLFNLPKSSPMLNNCVFKGNVAMGNAGGLYNWLSSNPKLANCTFIGNRANRGGGMHNNGSNGGCNPILTNCTFGMNSATNGNTIACDSDQQNYPSNLQMTNCILWGSGNEIWNNDGSTITITYSCVQDAEPDDSIVYPGAGNIDVDPLFVSNPDDGGDGWGDDTATEDVDEGANDDYGDLHLLINSPSIDAGDNSALPPDTADLDGDGNTTEPTPWDLDGNQRIIGDVVDMGCYEYVPGSENQAPVLQEIGNKSVDENTTLIFDVNAIDPDGDPLIYSVQNLLSGATFSNQTFSWTPTYDQAGGYQVTFIASDGQAQDSETITITVNNVNRPPILSGGPVSPSSGDTGTDFYWYVNYYDTDVDLPDTKNVYIDGTSYIMSFYSGSESNGTYRYGPMNLGVGSHNYYFYFTDGQGGSAQLPSIGMFSGPSVSEVKATVPNIVGMSQSDAESTITSAGLTVGTITHAYSSTVPTGDVISQNPSGGALVDMNSTVDLVISDGPQMVTVLFADGFENVAVGDYPDENGWQMMTSGETAYVSDVQAGSGSRSFRLEGRANWSRCDYVQLNRAEIEQGVTYEVSVYLLDAPQEGAYVGFGQLFGNQLPCNNKFSFGNNRVMAFVGEGPGVTFGNWEPNRWYRIRVEIDYTQCQADVYIDGSLVGENIPTKPIEFDDGLGHNVLDKFILVTPNWSPWTSAIDVVYFDDVRVVAGSTPPAYPNCDFCGPPGSDQSDGYVDYWDLLYFAQRWHSSPSDTNWDPRCDLAEEDNYVDYWDLLVFAKNWHIGEPP